jgi:uncharacterized protein YPO0396
MGVLLSMVDEHQKAVAITLRNAQNLLNESTLDAVMLLRKVVNDEHAYNSDRLKAANMILDRTLGRAREHLTVDVQGEPPWALAIRDMYSQLKVGPPSSDASAEIIDAEIVDEDPIFE